MSAKGVLITDGSAEWGENWSELFRRACSTRERLDLLPDTSDPCVREDDASRQLQKWCEALAGGNWPRFEQQLSRGGIDLRRLRSALAARPPIALPRWVHSLRESIEEAEGQDSGAGTPTFWPEIAPLPFRDLGLPFLIVARRHVVEQVASLYTALPDDARAALELDLLKQLSRISSLTYYREFTAFRACRQPAWVRYLQFSQGVRSERLYRLFVEHMLSAGLRSLLHEFSLLARLLATLADLWVESTIEFLTRLKADRETLRSTFGREDELGQVVALEPGLSDRHHGGRSVIAVTLASGLKVMYKPRDLALEEAFSHFLGWLGRHSPMLPGRIPRVLNCHTHGWMEFVDSQACRTPEEARRYFQRIGELLSLVYVFGGTDCHFENLIAAGEFPVLVDAEMVVQPTPALIHLPESDSDIDQSAFMHLMNESVLGTLLLPLRLIPSDESIYDVSAVGGGPAKGSAALKPYWEEINTDGMRRSRGRRESRASCHLPSLNGLRLSASEYVEQVVAGFRRTCGWFLLRRNLLLQDENGLAVFRGIRGRFVIRPTNSYAALFSKLDQPDLLRDGAETSLWGEFMLWSEIPSNEEALLAPFVSKELEALQLLDIPHFTVRTDSTAPELDSDSTESGLFCEPAYERICSRLRGLTEQDIENQVYLIRGSLCSGRAGSAHVPPSEGAGADGSEIGIVERLTGEVLMREARCIAETLRSLAVRSEHGSAAWNALAFSPRTRRFRVEPIGYSLFDGCSGVALFFSSLAQATKESRWRDLALQALEPIRSDLRAKRYERIFSRIGMEGSANWGTVIYALVQSSHFLNEPLLLEDAAQLAVLATPERIAADKNLDVLFGVAGLMLGLLALHRRSGCGDVLEIARRCGLHLLEQAVQIGPGARAWKTEWERPLTGFSHGAAGMAYALLRLFEATAEEEFRTLASDAHGYERSVFSPEAGNWPDFRSKRERIFASSWCHGAPGIGLARIGGLAVQDDESIRQEIDLAVKTTLSLDISPIDALCCGNLGLVELFLTAGHRLHRPELLEEAWGRTTKIVERARSRGSYSYMTMVVPSAPGFHPGFFQGASGLGYEFLRLSDPKQFPSVLLFE